MHENPNIFGRSRVPIDALRETAAELEERRQKVLRLRLRGLQQREIADGLNVNQSTVSRDLQWIAQHWHEKYGASPSLDPAEEIGEAIDVFAEVEATAFREHDRLKRSQTNERNTYLRTILRARQLRVNLLITLGFLDRRVENVGLKINADEVRRVLRDEGLLETAGGGVKLSEDYGGAKTRRVG